MSLQAARIEAIPEETARVARAAFPKGSTFMQMRDELGSLYEDSQFAALYPTRGQPAAAPRRLMLVCVMQFAEGLSDRQAADAVRSRIDWKYALGLELSDAGFDFSVLSEFRDRLAEGAWDTAHRFNARLGGDSHRESAGDGRGNAAGGIECPGLSSP